MRAGQESIGRLIRSLPLFPLEGIYCKQCLQRQVDKDCDDDAREIQGTEAQTAQKVEQVAK